MSCGSSYGAIGCAGRRPDRRAGNPPPGSSFASRLDGLHAAPPNPCRRAPHFSVLERLGGDRTRPARRAPTRARRYAESGCAALYASRSASAPPAGFSWPTRRRHASPAPRNPDPSSCVERDRREVRGLHARHARQHRRQRPACPRPAASTSARRARRRRRGRRARRRAPRERSSARSGSRPDSTSTKLLLIDGRRGAQRRDAHRRPRVGQTGPGPIGSPSAARSAPSAVTASRRTLGSRRRLRHRRASALRTRRSPDLRRARGRPTPQLQPASRVGVEQRRSAAPPPAASFSAPRPRAANARVYLPGRSRAAASSAGAARGSSTALQRVRDRPPRRDRLTAASSTAAASWLVGLAAGRAQTVPAGTPRPPVRPAPSRRRAASRRPAGLRPYSATICPMAGACAADRQPMRPSASAARPRTIGARVGEGGRERRRSRRLADEAQRECRHRAHVRIRVCQAPWSSGGMPSRRPTRPIASAARRRTLGFVVGG